MKSAKIDAIDYSYIDIAANPTIVSIIRSIKNLPMCVSSIHPLDFYKCKIAGADFIEIGNFNIYYSKKISFFKSDILKLIKSIAKLVPVSHICVIISHILGLHEQLELVISLDQLCINIIQTEGVITKSSIYINNQSIINSTCNAAVILSSTHTIAKYVKMAVLTSPGINPLSAPVAISYAAFCIGIGSALQKYEKSIYEIAKYIKKIVYSIRSTKNISFQAKAWQIGSISLSQIQV